MSPFQLEILLSYHYSTRDYLSPGRSYEAMVEALRDLCELQLLEENANAANDPGETKYKLAPRGKAYVEFVLNLPLPVMKWEMPPVGDAST